MDELFTTLLSKQNYPELRWTGFKLITLDSLINITLSWGNAHSHIDFYAEIPRNDQLYCEKLFHIIMILPRNI